MDIVRATFEQDGHDDLVGLLDMNDTRVIPLFAKYEIAFSDQVSDLLNMEMGLKFKEDIENITKEYPEFVTVTQKIVKDVSDSLTEFDQSILMDLLDYSVKEDCKVRAELQRCMNYYASFYLELPDFEPYPEEKNDDNLDNSEKAKEPELVKVGKENIIKTEENETDVKTEEENETD